MPFHVGGHKPLFQPPKRVVSIGDRLLVSMFGGVLIFGGVFRIRRGFDYILNWWGEPVYSNGLIIAGVIVILLGWVPTAWMEKAVAWGIRGTTKKSK
jgi:hypothetical protein